jgi:mRNA interferase RelE/StbE
MEIKPSPKFVHDYKNLPPLLCKRADEQLKVLMENPRHPSLGLKKMKGFPDIWEARVTRSYRFTFQIQGKFYLLRRIGTHDILKQP